MTTLVAAVLTCAATPLLAKRDPLPRIPGAALLTGWPPFRLAITGPHLPQIIQNHPQSDWIITPSITTDGREVASAQLENPKTPRSRNLVAAVWSKSTGHWIRYDQLPVRSGTIAISPDGSKLACVTRFLWNAPSRLKILDRNTGKITEGPEIFDNAGTDISWSPDSRHLAFDIGDNGSPVKSSPTPLRAIYVMDAATGAVRRIAKGVAPAWSPSGQWIAFLDYLPSSDDAGKGFAAPRPNRVEVMHPDGTGMRIVTTSKRDQGLLLAPVWLPDSQALLIQRWHDAEKATVDANRLDLTTGRVARVFQNQAPVFAWLQK